MSKRVHYREWIEEFSICKRERYPKYIRTGNNTTENPHDVTCKRCLAKLERSLE